MGKIKQLTENFLGYVIKLIILVVLIELALQVYEPYKNQLYVMAGKKMVEKQQYDFAVIIYGLAISEENPSVEALMGRAACYSRQKQYEKAINDYSAVIYVNGETTAEAYNAMGDIFVIIGDYNKAVEDYSKSITSRGKSVNLNDVLYKRGGLYLKLNKLEQAKSDGDDIVTRGPDQAVYYELRGDINIALGKLDDAAKDYQAAVQKLSFPRDQASSKRIQDKNDEMAKKIEEKKDREKAAVVIEEPKLVMTEKVWGAGFVSLKKEANLAGRVNFPGTPITLFAKPFGKELGQVVYDYYEDPGTAFFVMQINNRKTPIPKEDMIEINYEGYCLKYAEYSNGHIRILTQSLRDGAWIFVDELEANGYKIMSWRTYMLLRRGPFYPIVGTPNVDLRQNPDEKSSLVMPMQGERFKLQIVGITQGNWAEVDVYETDGPSGKGEIYNKWTGWIKAIDKDNHPTIWYYPKAETR